MAGRSSLIRDADQGKPILWSMEPRARLNTYARQINKGKPFPESLEHDAGRNPCPILSVQLWESTDEFPTNKISIRCPRP
jgi:hypothetical protein